MKNLILAVMLMLSFTAISASAFDNSNKKPAPKPSVAPKPSATRTATGKATPTPTHQVKTSFPFAASVFTFPAIIFFVVAGFVAMGIGAVVGGQALSDTGPSAGLRGLEAGILAVLGGLFARVFIAFLLSKGNDLAAAQIAIGWGFFLFPGAVDTFAKLGVHHPVTTPTFLLWFATSIGAFTGMMNGLWQIHNWKGIGWLAFPLDVTWGLAGATTGTLLHLIDAIAANHAREYRYDAHRYDGGMRFKKDFALTQGPVMSNLTTAPSTGEAKHDTLYYHERTHVWQNRVFGPLFTLTYLGWMAIWIFPALICAAYFKNIHAVEALCYYNNPWETWAYLVGAGPRTDREDEDHVKIPCIWGNLAVGLVSILFFTGIIFLFVWIVKRVWF